jgi:hypothetical protein
VLAVGAGVVLLAGAGVLLARRPPEPESATVSDASADASPRPVPSSPYADLFSVVSTAQGRALAWDAAAVLVRVEAGPLRGGQLDPRAGSRILVTFGKARTARLGPGAKVGEERLVVALDERGLTTSETRGPLDERAVAVPECTPFEAWRRLVASGVPSSAEPTLTYAMHPRLDRAVWVGEVTDDAKLVRTLDGRTCAILTR